MLMEYNSHQRVAFGITSGLLALSTIAVYARIYVRCVVLQSSSAGWDDVTAVIAWIMAVGASIAVYFEIMSGLGRHVEELTPDEVNSFSVSLFVMVQFYNAGNSTVKLSFLAQFLRLFPGLGIRRASLCLAMFFLVWMFAQAVMYSFSCVLIRGVTQDPTVTRFCLPSVQLATALTSINAFTNLVVFYLPLRPVWRMPLLSRQIYLVIGIFCVGFLVCIISIVRIPDLRHGVSSPDPTFNKVTTAGWALAELNVAIICTSLPVLQPLVARFVRGIDRVDELSLGDAGRSSQPTRRLNGLPTGSLRSDNLSGSTLESGGRSLSRSKHADHSLPRSKHSLMSLNHELERAAEKPPAMPTMMDYPKDPGEKPPDTPASDCGKTVAECTAPRSLLSFYPRDPEPPPVPPIPPIRTMSPISLRYSSASSRHTTTVTTSPGEPLDKLTDTTQGASSGASTPRHRSTSTRFRSGPPDHPQRPSASPPGKPRCPTGKAAGSALLFPRPPRTGTYSGHSRHRKTPNAVGPGAESLAAPAAAEPDEPDEPDEPAPPPRFRTQDERPSDELSRRPRRSSETIPPSSLTGLLAPEPRARARPQPRWAREPASGGKETVVVPEPFVERGIRSQRDRGLQVEHVRTGQIVRGRGIRVVEVRDDDEDRPESRQASLLGERSQTSTPSIRQWRPVPAAAAAAAAAGDPGQAGVTVTVTPSGLNPAGERSPDRDAARGPIVRARLRAAELEREREKERERGQQRKRNRLQQIIVPEQDLGAADGGGTTNNEVEGHSQSSRSAIEYAPWWESERGLEQGA